MASLPADRQDREPSGLPSVGSGSVDYVLRTAQQETIAISTLADQKANILLGVSLIMTTVIIGVLPSTGMTFALGILGVSSAVAAILTLLSLLPSRPITGREPNPLYFVDVADMTYEAYTETMADVLAKTDSLYQAILADLYQSSRFLVSRKFRFLRAAYLVFLIGLVLTAVGVGIDIASGTI